MKQNFILTHTEISRDQPEWKTENKRVGTEQKALEEKTTEVINLCIQEMAPAEVINLLGQAKMRIGEAGVKILSQENQGALPIQGKALGYITEVERFFTKIAPHAKSPEKDAPKVQDPFEKEKDLELKQRSETKSGELELLTREQERLANDLAKTNSMSTPKEPTTPDANRIDGTFPERETQISQRLGALLNSQVFAPEVTAHLEKGRTAAQESLKQLDAQEVETSREPAASAARELQQALSIMNQKGEELAKEQMNEALRLLIQAAQDARTAPKKSTSQSAQDKADHAADQVKKAQQTLAKAAEKQQETGSAKEAERMAALANQLNQPKLKEALKELQAHPQNEEAAKNAANQIQHLAEQAAKAPNGKASAAELAELIQRLERSQANLKKLATSASKAQNGSDNPHEPKSDMKNPTGQTVDEKNTSKEPKPSSEGESKGGEKGAGGPLGSGKSEPGGGVDASPQKDSTTEIVPEAGSTSPGISPSPDAKNPGGDGSGGPMKSPNKMERFSRELIDDLRLETIQAAAVLPPSPEIEQLQKTLEEQEDSKINDPQSQSLASLIAEPLDGVIHLLRAEMQTLRRKHQLIERDLGKAPPIYREAVADYFEQLSHEDGADHPEEKTGTDHP